MCHTIMICIAVFDRAGNSEFSFGLPERFYFGEFPDTSQDSVNSAIEKTEKYIAENPIENLNFVRIHKVWIMESPIPYSEMTIEQCQDMMSYNTDFGKHISTYDVPAKYNPETECFICHKCGGRLKGINGPEWCNCISGWIRPNQQPVKIERCCPKGQR